MKKYVEVTHLMDFTPDKELLTVGNKYEVVEENLDGVSIKVNESTPNYFVYNNQIKRVEEKEMKYTEKDIYEGMELLCIDNGGWSLWETGEIYTVTKSNLSGKLIIEGDDEVGRTFRDTEAILGYLNGERGTRLSTIEDQKEEEKEMKKYAKITKYAGLIDTDKENGLEIGKEYEIVKFNSVSEDCWVYLNDKRPEYFISETQYELVEKEVPKLKANVNVDVKEAIQDKIDELRTEAEHLFKKRNRMECQMFNLNSKANKLEEVLETIKEFE
ncbi:tail length tape-measure protein [Enterococcus phage vB_EfaS-271]|nr:tail length tape-measure protein [Enterococcus phage vB_EfaS-271]